MYLSIHLQHNNNNLNHQPIIIIHSQSRNRAENEENTSEKKLLATLNDLHRFNTDEGCEERILCELLLSAGASDHAETHVENLLQAFTET